MQHTADYRKEWQSAHAYILQNMAPESLLKLLLLRSFHVCSITIQSPLKKKKKPQIVTLLHSERHTMQAQILATCESAQSKITNSWR